MNLKSLARFLSLHPKMAVTTLNFFGICALCLSSTAAPLFEQQQLFTPTATNYYHIPGLAVTAKGTTLAYAAWRDVEANDWGKIFVTMRCSTDSGKTWGPETKLAPQGTPPLAVVRSSPPKPKGKTNDIVVDNCMVNGAPSVLGNSVHFVNSV